MSQGLPALVIFDMNDVLCRYDTSARVNFLAQVSGRSARHIKTVIWDSGFEDESDEGRYADAKTYLAEFCRRLGANLTAEQWIEACRAAIAPNPPVLELAVRMKEVVRLVLFSNNGPLMKQALPQIFPEAHRIFGAEFYCSFEFKARKPHPLAYVRLSARLGFRPDECLYIDDRLENVEGAQKAGLSGHHFTSAAVLAATARALGLLA